VAGAGKHPDENTHVSVAVHTRRPNLLSNASEKRRQPSNAP
jgi:hypothetical protein